MQKITTFLMFDGKAEEAMHLYVSLFPGSEIKSMVRHGPDQPSFEGKVQNAVLSLNNQEFMFFDSPVKHDFTFTPAISLFVHCETEAEIDRLFAGLSQDGIIFMPLAAYPFSPKFGWLADRYGVSWQLSLVTAQSA
jgi:predicted 3-demethylubiquinone-9 3-methyltransferase (glyoxalase superfamily)